MKLFVVWWLIGIGILGFGVLLGSLLGSYAFQFGSFLSLKNFPLLLAAAANVGLGIWKISQGNWSSALGLLASLVLAGGALVFLFLSFRIAG